MSKSDQFRQYAEEAMFGFSKAKTEEERQILFELLCTWAEAAAVSEFIPGAGSKVGIRVH